MTKTLTQSDFFLKYKGRFLYTRDVKVSYTLIPLKSYCKLQIASDVYVGRYGYSILALSNIHYVFKCACDFCFLY